MKVPNYQTIRPATPPAVRFWSKVEKTETCWIWRAGHSSNGYGFFDGVRAHTWVAKHVMKVRFSHKNVIDHICRNKLCVRPEHLRLVPQRVNLQNSPTWRGAKTHCNRGHLLSGSNLYAWGGHRYCRTCRSKYLKLRRKQNG